MGSYYHWTDEETYKSIIRRKNFIQAFFSRIFGLEPHELVPGKGGRDEYGEGVYFTDCGPEYARSTIAGRCFGHSSSTDQVECYFLVNFHGNAKITKEREHVWKLSPKTTAKQFIEDHGYHPDFESDDDDDDDDEEDWVPSCTECGTDESVSDPGEDSDYYWCSYCECDIDDDGDRVEENVTCPWCGDDDVTLCTQDDDYDGQRIYTCCAAYFDENGDLWPEENPNGEYCRFCGENPHAQSCVREMCGNCCDGAGCPRHGDDDDDDDDDDDWVPTCNECGDSDDVEDPGGDYYWCNYCECDIDSDGDAV